LYESKKELVRKIYSRKEREGLRREREAAKLVELKMERREAGDVEGVGCFGGFAPRRKMGESNGLLPV
jgi:hypothetical protein